MRSVYRAFFGAIYAVLGAMLGVTIAFLAVKFVHLTGFEPGAAVEVPAVAGVATATALTGFFGFLRYR
ncbi:hypothetical protein GCM10011390_02790 [Aureimonas endophytica]|uniref:Uncharacterized protein n=1 Tax=Aureimonas endophytica TaxID=2027858 RepID=A0A916ZCQ2_9HYPH|nr:MULTISPECIES: hypothetical protein [Aureimonas]GGD87547.1 hypothetical protein GCM10011390_02790 [Aureimonas endophytica]